MSYLEPVRASRPMGADVALRNRRIAFEACAGTRRSGTFDVTSSFARTTAARRFGEYRQGRRKTSNPNT